MKRLPLQDPLTLCFRPERWSVAVPDYETLMLPILKFLSDEEEHRTSALVTAASDEFGLTEDERRELIPSGRAKLINNRVGWACTYLRKAGLIQSRQRGVNQITEAGLEALRRSPKKIDSDFLSQFEAFKQFKRASNPTPSDAASTEEIREERTPEEIIGIQNQIIVDSLQSDILDQISTMDPDRFEQLVVDLLISMGYGGTAEDAGRAIGRSNDGGIDGVIMEDVLGLDTIYVQAKRWRNAVPIKEVRDFAGALLSKRSNKGVFITASSFPFSAYEFVNSIDRKIILIDGKRLTELMVKFDLGVSTKQTIAIKELDSDYFTT